MVRQGFPVSHQLSIKTSKAEMGSGLEFTAKEKKLKAKAQPEGPTNVKMSSIQEMKNQSKEDSRVWSQRHVQWAFDQVARCGNRGKWGKIPQETFMEPPSHSHKPPLLKVTAPSHVGATLPGFMLQVTNRVRYLFQGANG